MNKTLDLVSLGEAVVEVFRKNVDESLSEPFDFIGPYPSGAPAITTDTMAKLGGRCAFLAAVGHDDFGECVVSRLKRDGVDVTGMRFLDRTITGIAFTSYASDGSRKFIFNFTTAATAAFAPEHLDEEKIQRAKWLHISGNVMAFSENSRRAVLRACEVAQAAGTKISFDPNIRLEIMDRNHLLALFAPVLQRASLVIPSQGELTMIFSGMEEEKARAELFAYGVETVVCKEGEQGCTMYFAGAQPLHVPAMQWVREVDATGCGDAFCAGLLYGMIQGWDARKCGLFANAVGGVTAMQKGAMEGLQHIQDVYGLLKRNGVANFFNL